MGPHPRRTESRGLRDYQDSTPVRLAVNLILACIVPFAIWSVNMIQRTHDDVIKLQEQMAERTTDRYTATDARKDITGVLNLIQRNQQDITALALRQSTDEQYIYSRIFTGDSRPRN